VLLRMPDFDRHTTFRRSDINDGAVSSRVKLAASALAAIELPAARDET
jgi:hypothetical protein